MRILPILLFIFCALPVIGGVIADKLSESSAKWNSVIIEARQTKFITFFDDKIESRILIAADKSGKLRFEILSPYRSLTIFDGTKLGRYEFENGSFKSLSGGENVGRIMADIAGIASGDLSRAGKFCDISEIDGKLVLSIKGAAAKVVEKIVVEPKPDFSSPQKIIVFERGGDRTEIEILKIVRDPKNIEPAFDVSNPEKFGGGK